MNKKKTTILDVLTFTFQDWLFKNLTQLADTIRVTFKNLHFEISLFNPFNFCEYFQFLFFVFSIGLISVIVLVLFIWMKPKPNIEQKNKLVDTKELQLAKSLMVRRKNLKNQIN